MVTSDMHLTIDTARAFVTQVLVALDVPEDEAAIVADTLVEAEARGVPSHGLFRLTRYVAKYRDGHIVCPTPLTVVKETASTLLMDGGLGWGQVIGVRTMERCIAKAREAGSCIASVRNANHFGAGAYYVEMAARAGMIGMAMAASGEAGDGICVAPWGGYRPLIDTNPMAFGFPGGAAPGVTLDMATTAVSQGRLRIYEQRGEQIPDGWALDRDGNPTNDPTAGLAGTMLPLGGYKGYGLGLVVDLLCRLLPGSVYPHTPNDGHFFAAIDISAFQPLEQFQEAMDRNADTIASAPRRPGFDEILLPGQRGHRARQQSMERGVTVAARTWQGIVELATDLKLSPPVV